MTCIDWDLAKNEIDTASKMAFIDSTVEARRKANRWWNKLRNKKEGNT